MTDDVIASGFRYQLYIDGRPVPIIAPGEGGHRVDFSTEIDICVNDALHSGAFTVTAIDRAGNESAPTQPIQVDLG